MKKILLLLISLISLQVFAQETKISNAVHKALNSIDTLIIRSHIAYLADDKLQGRLPGTEGYELAVEYVINQYKDLGLLPLGDNGDYRQKLILRKASVVENSVFALIKDNAGKLDTLVLGRDFSPVPNPIKPHSEVDATLAFVGYGVDIPEIYSDYSTIDANGKIVVLMSGVPDGLPSTLTAHYSSLGNKVSTAFSKGAIGAVFINLNALPSTNPNRFVELNVAFNSEKNEVYGRVSKGELPVLLVGNKQLVRKFFAGSDKDLELVITDIRNKKASSFDFPFKLQAGYQSTYDEFESHNVIGLIPGSDKKLKNEYVVHSAHLDHVGIGVPIEGDSIYNGAHDNASGVASLLEIARIYQDGKAKPKRSILIAMVTAEEMGLLGSSYFAANPTVPKESIIANVNTDMPTFIAPLLSFVPLGAEHSSILQHAQFAGDYLGLELERDPEPEQVRFVRSDQYSFVLEDIPALHVKYGNKTNDPKFDLDSLVKSWRSKYYHMPQDGLDGIFNYSGAKTYIQLNFLVSYSIAQTAQKPTWNIGDVFGDHQK
nr:M28 family peptidase [Cytophagales bacterium]